jgi:8-hydroxy-5-deazaflavin:NADPH oxidoreductase
MRVGIIGAGNIGQAVATRLIASGRHTVLISNSRGPESLSGLEQELGQAASAATTDEAARDGEVIVVATPLAAVPELPAEALTGKVVVDANNYYTQRDGTIAELEAGLGSSEWLAQQVPGARVVKAFNTMWSENIIHKAVPAGAEERVAMPVAGDDDEAKATVFQLIDDMGFDPVDAGTLRDGRRQEPGTAVYNVLLDADGVREALDRVPEA